MPETTKHRQAFDLYWRLGAERSIERLHAELRRSGRAPSLRTLYEWSRLHHWQDRLAELERKARESADETRLTALAEMYSRHAKEGILLQQKGTEWLTATEAEDVGAEAAIRAITEGARLERLARGEPTEREEVTSGNQPHARLAALTDAQLEGLIERIHGDLAGEAPPPSD